MRRTDGRSELLSVFPDVNFTFAIVHKDQHPMREVWVQYVPSDGEELAWATSHPNNLLVNNNADFLQ